ncbi:hypothetical protein Peur_005766 [Populus x canadensis]
MMRCCWVYSFQAFASLFWSTFLNLVFLFIIRRCPLENISTFLLNVRYGNPRLENCDERVQAVLNSMSAQCR